MNPRDKCLSVLGRWIEARENRLRLLMNFENAHQLCLQDQRKPAKDDVETRERRKRRAAMLSVNNAIVAASRSLGEIELLLECAWGDYQQAENA